MRLVGFGVLCGAGIAGLLVTEQVSDFGEVIDRQSISGLNSNFTSYVLIGSLYLYVVMRKVGVYPRWVKLLTIPLFLFFGMKLHVLGTRGAVFGFYGVLAWMFLGRFMTRRLLISMVGAALFIVFFVSFGFVDIVLVQLDALFGRSTGDLTGRLPLWSIAREFISNDILLGIGAGSFAGVNPRGIGAHNVFLTFFLDVGLIGLMLFLFFLLNLIFPALKAKAMPDCAYIVGGFIVFWLPISISGHWELAPFSWLLLGLVYNMLRLENSHV